MARMQGQEQQQVYLWVQDFIARAIGYYPGIVKQEYRFHPTRRFRFDVAIPELHIGIEVDGLLPGAGGGHQRRQAYIQDRVKDLEAQCLGWQVIRVVTDQVRDGSCFPYLEKLIRRRYRGPEE